jgi:Ca-activated chloride channel family protein
MDTDWTNELAKINRLFYKLNMKGTTPTGPAILTCVRHIAGPQPNVPMDKGGLLSEYVI